MPFVVLALAAVAVAVALMPRAAASPRASELPAPDVAPGGEAPLPGDLVAAGFATYDALAVPATVAPAVAGTSAPATVAAPSAIAAVEVGGAGVSAGAAITLGWLVLAVAILVATNLIGEAQRSSWARDGFIRRLYARRRALHFFEVDWLKAQLTNAGVAFSESFVRDESLDEQITTTHTSQGWRTILTKKAPPAMVSKLGRSAALSLVAVGDTSGDPAFRELVLQARGAALEYVEERHFFGLSLAREFLDTKPKGSFLPLDAETLADFRALPLADGSTLGAAEKEQLTGDGAQAAAVGAVSDAAHGALAWGLSDDEKDRLGAIMGVRAMAVDVDVDGDVWTWPHAKGHWRAKDGSPVNLVWRIRGGAAPSTEAA